MMTIFGLPAPERQKEKAVSRASSRGRMGMRKATALALAKAFSGRAEDAA
jgi:hypothetical protein